MISLFFEGMLFVALFMLFLYLVHLIQGKADIVDAGWAASLGLLAIYYAAASDAPSARSWMVAVLVGVWSARLTFHLVTNRVLAPEEDGRYEELRTRWNPNASRNFFIFFQAQGLLAVFLSIPFLVILSKPEPYFSGWDLIGVALFVVAQAGEALADWQLAQHKANPDNKGKTCRSGLWRYSRHPNYFFEWLHWAAYLLLSFGAPWAVLSIISPALMLYLIVKVTGIPPTEARALATRGDDYREYQRTTSAFIPLPPKQ